MSLSNKLTTQKQESLWAYWEFLVLVSAKSNFGIIENLVFFYECVQFVGCIERLLEGGLGWETSPFQCSYWLHSRILKPLTILPHSGWQAGNPSAVWCVLDAVKSVPLADWEAGCSPPCLPDIWSAVVALLCHLFACLLFEECAIVRVSDSVMFCCNSHIAEERLTRDTLPAHHDPLFHRAYLLLCSGSTRQASDWDRSALCSVQQQKLPDTNSCGRTALTGLVSQTNITSISDWDGSIDWIICIAGRRG